MPGMTVLFAFDGSPHARAAIERAGTLLKPGPAVVATAWTTFEEAAPGALLEDHLNALHTLRGAISYLAMTAPNGRDYQTALRDAFAAAINEHRSRLARLERPIQNADMAMPFHSGA